MTKRRNISSVFNYVTPMSLDQIDRRAFVDRSYYTEQVLTQLRQDGVLIISGYSSIGKTSLINIATSKQYLSNKSLTFHGVVHVLADTHTDGNILEVIYHQIASYISGKQHTISSPMDLARLIHYNRLLVIIEGVNGLYRLPRSSSLLFDLCKAWTDLPRGSETQSKIVLVVAGHIHWANHWLTEVGKDKRLPREHIYLPPWSTHDLREIVRLGSERLNIVFQADLQEWMNKVACGLPATMTLLASLVARHANNGQDDILKAAALSAEADDLYGVFGEGQAFRQTLHYNNSISTLTPSHLLTLYILGINGGHGAEKSIVAQLESFGYSAQNVIDDMRGLVFRTSEDGDTIYNLYELSYGTFAFLQLYHLSKLAIPDAHLISKALRHINNYTDLSELQTGVRTMLDKGDNIFPKNQEVSILFLPQQSTLLRLILRHYGSPQHYRQFFIRKPL